MFSLKILIQTTTIVETLETGSVILFSCLVFGTMTSSCQNGSKNQTIQAKDSSEVNLIKPDSESFKLEFRGKILMEGALWDKERVSVSIIPFNDSLAEKFTYSGSKILTSKRQVKLVKGKYLEDGISYHFNDKGILSHVYNYKSGVMNGEAVTYYDNGMVESKGLYKDGDKSGIWEFFDRKGKLMKKEKN